MLTKPPTLLIIEDSDIAEPLAKALRSYGYTVRTNSLLEGDVPEDLGIAPDEILETPVIPTDLIFYPWRSGEEERSARISKYRRYLPNLAVIFLYPVVNDGCRVVPRDPEGIGSSLVDPRYWNSPMLEADRIYCNNSTFPKVRVAAWPYFFLNLTVFDTSIGSPVTPPRSTYGDDLLRDLVPI